MSANPYVGESVHWRFGILANRYNRCVGGSVNRSTVYWLQYEMIYRPMQYDIGIPKSDEYINVSFFCGVS